MGLLHALRFRARGLLDRRRMDAELDEEMAFHIEAEAAELARSGVPIEAARREARRRFGGMSRTRDDVRDAEGLAWWDALRQHATYSIRGIRRAPGFASMVALTLALGIGANGAMFGIIDRLVLRGPTDVVRPGELERVYITTRNGAGGEQTSATHQYALYTLLRERTSAFTALAAYSPSTVRIGRGTASHSVPVTYATASFFPLVGVRPYLGRFFDSTEDAPPVGANVVVVGYGFWIRELGADSTVIGRTITLGSRTGTVIGIAPPGFTGVERRGVDAWLPMSTEMGRSDWATTWNATWARIVGRRNGTIGARLADEQVTAALHAGYTGLDPSMRRARVTLRPISYDENGNEPPELGIARLLYGVAIVVLLIAAANVANLLLARATRRRRELGVRVALGAGRTRLATMLVTEAAALALLGGAIGCVLAWWGGEFIRRTLFPSIAWDGPPVDSRVLLYAAAATIVTTVLVGVVPAIQSTRGDTITALRSGIAQAGERHSRTRVLLQVGEVTFSLVLVFVAALFVRSLAHVRSLDLGFDPDHVLTVGLALPEAPEARTAAEANRNVANEHQRYREILAAIRRSPGVADASVAVGVPLYSSYGIGMDIPGRDSLPPAKGGGLWIHAVASGFFETIGTRVLRGRSFTEADHEGAEPVVIVNETMARTYWPGEDALTKCIRIQGGGGCRRIVGVVSDVMQWKLREDAAMQYYVPYGQENSIGGPMLLVRPRGDAQAFAAELRTRIGHLAPDARFVDVRTLAETLDPQVRPWRVGSMMFGLFGSLALIVAAVGLFSVLSYAVAQRTHEFGVRIALGARPRQIVRLVLRRALVVGVAGTAIGIVVSLAVAPLVEPMLFDAKARDPLVLALVSAALLATAVAAAMLPSWRASRVEPLTALRAD